MYRLHRCIAGNAAHLKSLSSLEKALEEGRPIADEITPLVTSDSRVRQSACGSNAGKKPGKRIAQKLEVRCILAKERPNGIRGRAAELF